MKLQKEYGYCLVGFLTGFIIIILAKLGFHWFDTWVGIALMILSTVMAIAFYIIQKKYNPTKPYRV
jgi:cell division protein FtsW (lipid II flippase)